MTASLIKCTVVANKGETKLGVLPYDGNISMALIKTVEQQKIQIYTTLSNNCRNGFQNFILLEYIHTAGCLKVVELCTN